MNTPLFDALATEYPGIHRASHLFPEPAPEPHISFIRERGAWLPRLDAEPLLRLVRWAWS